MPLQTRKEWAAWKDVPSDLNAWGRMNEAFAAHLRARGQRGIRYEVWNEPDMPEGDSKMFFTGSPEDYGRVYRAARAGLRQGDPDAALGGPAIAYDRRYLALILDDEADFASIHAYANYAPQIAGMREALRDRPDLPILLTEYASFTEFRPDGPTTRSDAAAAFFRDADGLLRLTDVTKVYWAQWIDDTLGLVDRQGHRRAIFNAFRVYAMMPTDRVAVSRAPEGLTVLASAGPTEMGIVVANPTGTDREVALDLAHRPVRSGTLEVRRIDRHHASHGDDPATEALRVDETVPLGDTWTGTVPAQGVVFLRAGRPAPAPKIPQGTVVRDLHRFPDRKTAGYAEFDSATWTARLGEGPGLVGAEIEEPSRRLLVTRVGGGEAALRVGYRGRDGRFTAGVLRRTRGFGADPWGGAGRTRDLPRRLTIDLAREAPRDWDGRRVTLWFANGVGPTEGAGDASRVRFTIGSP